MRKLFAIAFLSILVCLSCTRPQFEKVSLDEGVRLDGSRHPHSWSNKDNEDCIEWVLGLFECKPPGRDSERCWGARVLTIKAV